MRLVIARCSVDYAGRLTAHLPPAVRLLMVKADGCVAIHADGGAYKPLNWMNAPNTVPSRSTTTGRASGPSRTAKGETLTHHDHEVLSDTSHELGVDPGLRRTASRPTCRSCWPPTATPSPPACVLVRREYPTDIGPVDLLCRDADGAPSRSRSSAAARSTASSS